MSLQSLQTVEPNGRSGSGIGIGKKDIGGPFGYHVNSSFGFPFLHVLWMQVAS